MARAPRIGFIVAFSLTIVGAGGVAAFLALRPLVATVLATLRPPKAPPKAATPPRRLDVHPPPQEPAATAGRPLEEGLSQLDVAHDLKAYGDFDAALQARLLKGDLSALEGLGAELTESKARFPGGGWKLHRFGEALAKCPTGEDSPDTAWQQHLDRLKAWTAAYPRSKVAHGVSALAWVGFGWKARGSDYANTVTEDGWRLLRERLKAGRDCLEAAPVEARSPLWYSGMQAVALGQSWDRQDYDRLFSEAVALEPAYLSFYTRRAYYLLPRWHGEPGEAEAFVAKAADELGGEAGDQIFAQVLLGLAGFDSIKEWRSAHTGDWPRMKRGFQALRKQFGPSLRLENQCLRAAGYAGDLAFAQASAKAIGGRMDPEVWNSREAFADFRDWALCQGKYAAKH